MNYWFLIGFGVSAIIILALALRMRAGKPFEEIESVDKDLRDGETSGDVDDGQLRLGFEEEAGNGSGGGERDLDEEFLQKVEEGASSIPFIRAYSSFDCDMIRSLLSARGIVSLAEFSHMRGVLPGITLTGCNDTVIRILEKDVEAARLIFMDYLAVRKDGRSLAATEAFRNVAEGFIGAWAVPSTGGTLLPGLVDEE